MALKTAKVSDVPNLDQVPENVTPALNSGLVCKGKFVVMGHRGSGMNMLQSWDQRMKAIKENTILSFNAAAAAANSSLHFVEFDVQVTKDDCAVIFHDNFILTEENSTIVEKRVTELTLAELLSYGPQREPGNVGKPLLRKTKDGRIFKWEVEKDDTLCTLEETFLKVHSSLGFNIELKFDDHIIYEEQELIHSLQIVLQVVFKYAKERPIIFSTFQPNAAELIRKLQKTYPVFFLTNGGSEVFADVRRNSLDEALKLCLANGLQGIVSEVKAIFRNPGDITRIKDSNLALLTYGQLNNVPEAVYMQHLMGVDGVIVDLVQEITEVVSDFTKPVEEVEEEEECTNEEERKIQVRMRPRFSQHELSFLLKLIPELIQH